MVDGDASLYLKWLSCITTVANSIKATYNVFCVETYEVKNVGIGKKWADCKKIVIMDIAIFWYDSSFYLKTKADSSLERAKESLQSVYGSSISTRT